MLCQYLHGYLFNYCYTIQRDVYKNIQRDLLVKEIVTTLDRTFFIQIQIVFPGFWII